MAINWKEEVKKAREYLTKEQQKQLDKIIRDLGRITKKQKGFSIDWQKIYDLCVNVYKQNIRESEDLNSEIERKENNQ